MFRELMNLFIHQNSYRTNRLQQDIVAESVKIYNFRIDS